VKIHYKQPASFDGSVGLDFFEWYDQVQGLHQVYKYSDEEYLHIIVGALSGVVACWLLLQPSQTQLNPEALLEVLKNTYGHCNEGVLACQVNNCHQGAEEHCCSYWQ
jgi:hypothetical protein